MGGGGKTTQKTTFDEASEQELDLARGSFGLAAEQGGILSGLGGADFDTSLPAGAGFSAAELRSAGLFVGEGGLVFDATGNSLDPREIASRIQPTAIDQITQRALDLSRARPETFGAAEGRLQGFLENSFTLNEGELDALERSQEARFNVGRTNLQSSLDDAFEEITRQGTKRGLRAFDSPVLEDFDLSGRAFIRQVSQLQQNLDSIGAAEEFGRPLEIFDRARGVSSDISNERLGALGIGVNAVNAENAALPSPLAISQFQQGLQQSAFNNRLSLGATPNPFLGPQQSSLRERLANATVTTQTPGPSPFQLALQSAGLAAKVGGAFFPQGFQGVGQTQNPAD